MSYNYGLYMCSCHREAYAFSSQVLSGITRMGHRKLISYFKILIQARDKPGIDTTRKNEIGKFKINRDLVMAN